MSTLDGDGGLPEDFNEDEDYSSDDSSSPYSTSSISRSGSEDFPSYQFESFNQQTLNNKPGHSDPETHILELPGPKKSVQARGQSASACPSRRPGNLIRKAKDTAFYLSRRLIRSITGSKSSHWQRVDNLGVNVHSSDIHNSFGALPVKYPFVRKMYNFSIKYHVEICIVIFLLATGMPFLGSKPLKTRPVQSPSPFFDPHEVKGIIEDHHTGEYVDLVQKQIPRSPSIVLYYAPWDSECLAAKDVFFEVARYFKFKYGDQLQFHAVNCWWPEGQCRRNYKNLSHYPIVVAHISSAGGVVYNGPLRVELLIRFINLILFPIKRIDTEEELWRFRAQHDAIMLASFDFTSKSAPAYDVYLQMALRHLEVDPLGQVGYGVLLSTSLAKKYFVTSPNAISLVLFNEIHTAKWHGGATQDTKAPVKQVVEWVMERTKSTPMTWAYRVRSGFSNRPVSLGTVDVAHEAANGPIILLVTKRYYPSAHSPLYMQVKGVALDYYNCNKSGNVTRLRRYTHKISGEWLKFWALSQKQCSAKDVEHNYDCQILRQESRTWRPDYYRAKRETLASYERGVSEKLNFTGSSCRSERPFRFIAIDPSDVPYFLDVLLGSTDEIPGVPITSHNESFGFVIDAQNHFMTRLPSLKASEIAAAIHAYETRGPTFPLTSSRLPNSPATQIVKNDNSSVLELTIEQLKTVLNEPPGEDLFVIYTSKFCGYCGIALPQFIGLATFLKQYNVPVKLIKVDVFKKFLPGSMEPGELPSFFFVPSHNYTDLRLYPPGTAITTRNLLRFVLSEIEPDVRVQMSTRSPICSSESLTPTDESSSLAAPQTRAASCLKLNRKLVTAQIGSFLKTVKRYNGESETGLAYTYSDINEETVSEVGYYEKEKLVLMKNLLCTNSSRNHVSIQRCKQIDANGVSGVPVTFTSRLLASWSYQVLDHLRDTRIMLDMA